MAKRKVYYGTADGTATFIRSAQCEYDVPPGNRDPKPVAAGISEYNARSSRSVAKEALYNQMNENAGLCFKPTSVHYNITEKEIDD